MYLRSKELTGGLESLSEIGFKLMGRKSIYMINTLILINCTGSLIAYFNIFGNILTSIFKDIGFSKESIFADPTLYILILALLNLPPIFKRTVKELKIISYLLFFSVFIFVLGLLIELSIVGTSYNPDLSYYKYYEFNWSRETITSISIFLWAYSF